MSQSHYRNAPALPGVAFVTGGFRGLGNAIACSFSKEGARGVVLVDINDEETRKEGKAAVEKYGAKCLTIRADITKEAEVERAVAEAVAEFGRIDYAANFAGIFGELAMTSEMPYENWLNVMNVNVNGVMLCTKHEMRQMIKQDSIGGIEEGRVPQRGAIVNACSVNSRQSGAGAAAYTASKHAVDGITKAAALEGRAHDIRVNAVSPGFLLTKLLAPAFDSGLLTTEAWDTFTARQGRQATFDEVGDVVAMISSPRFSLVNGTNIPIDNGFTINEMPN